MEFNIMASKLGAYELLNIKQLMKEKQKVEAIVESISDGIVVMGAENRILLINKAAEKIFKIKEKEVLKKYFLEVIKNDDLFNFCINVRNENYESITKDYLDISIKSMNRINHYRALAKPITNIEGESIGVVLLLQDITKLKEVDELKSEFVASVSHELRTPITSVIMAAELLQDEIPGKVNKPQKELLKIVVEDSNRLKNLINDILDLSKLESGKTILDIRKNDLVEIVNYVLKILEMQIKEENITIKIELKKNLPPILCDYSKISQVLTNLIINSINYKIGNKALILKIGAKVIKGDKVLVYLSDNGRGITEEDQKKIFDKFVRIDTYNINNEEIVQGTGLGLTISKSIIKSHNGNIWVESEIGKGSTFYFTLDAAKKIDKNPML
jgi:PAS domain S-box-containing protein